MKSCRNLTQSLLEPNDQLLEGDEQLAQPIACPSCGNSLYAGASFCGNCGKGLSVTESTESSNIFQQLSTTLIFYFLLLALLLVYKLSSDDSVELLWFMDGLVSLVTIFFAIATRRYFIGKFSFHKVRPATMALVILGAIGAAIAVDFVAGLLNAGLFEEDVYETLIFQDTAYPVMFAILSICIQPAIFEEIAFRGFVFSNIADVSNDRSAIYISGFLFGIMHLSVVGLFWLVPLGLAAGWLRYRYNTLWYGMFAHFTYNLTIIMLEFYRLGQFE